MSAPEELGETQILGALLGIAEMVGGLTDTRELLEAVVRIAPGLVRVDRCAVLAYDEANRGFRTTVYFGPPGVGPGFEGLILRESEIPRLAHRLAVLHLPAFVKPDSQDSAFPPHLVQRLGIKSSLLVPLVCRGRTFGVLWLDDSKHSHYFTSREINVIQGVATVVAVALDSAARTESLALERRKIEALARSLSSGVIVLDRDLRVLEMDGPAEDLLGWHAAEVRGRPVHELLGTAGAEEGMDRTREAAAPSSAAKTLRLRTRQGKEVLCELLVVPVPDEAGETRQVLYVIRSPSAGDRKETRFVTPAPRS